MVATSPLSPFTINLSPFTCDIAAFNHSHTLIKIFLMSFLYYSYCFVSIFLTKSRFSESKEKLVYLYRTLAISQRNEYREIFRGLQRRTRQVHSTSFLCKVTTQTSPNQYPNHSENEKLSTISFAKIRPIHYLCRTKRKICATAETLRPLHGDAHTPPRRR